MSHLEREGNRIRVVGPTGSYLFRTDFGPGYESADPYGGPGGTTYFELELYEDGANLYFVATCVREIYGESRTNIVYRSRDGGQDFRPLSGDAQAQGVLVERLVLSTLLKKPSAALL